MKGILVGLFFKCKDPDKIKNVFKQGILNNTLNKQVYYKPVDHLLTERCV